MMLFIHYYRSNEATAYPKNYVVVPPAPVTPRLATDAAPTGQAVVLALIGDATGRVLGELTPDIQSVSWLINNYGEAAMTFAATDPALTGGLIAPGRRILLQFDNGLPDWGGILDVPIDRDGLTVSLRAYEPGYLLKFRLTGRNVTGMTGVQALAEALIRDANAEYPSGLELSVTNTIDDQVEADYHYTPLWDVFERDIGQYAEFYFRARLGENITFPMYMAAHVGFDHSRDVQLLQGVNMQRPQVVEQGPIVSEFFAVTDDGDWDETAVDPRIVQAATDTASTHQFGLRQALTTVPDTEIPAVVLDAAEAALDEFKEPYIALTTNVLNLAPGTFAQYDLGDTVNVLMLETYGESYDINKRVIGREFYPADGTCQVILK